MGFHKSLPNLSLGLFPFIFITVAPCEENILKLKLIKRLEQLSVKTKWQIGLYCLLNVKLEDQFCQHHWKICRNLGSKIEIKIF